MSLDMSRVTRCFAAILIAGAMVACSPYTLRGRVVQGEVSYVDIVDEDDHRLAQPGVSSVALKLTLDPSKLNRKVIAQNYSDEKGDFEMRVDEGGAGLLTFETALLARKRGFQSAEGVFNLPGGSSKRVLIVLTPGNDPAGAYEQEPTTEELLDRFK